MNIICLPLFLSAVFGEFTQRFEAIYETPESARRAVVSAADIPPGKSFSFSQRWDDANWRNRKMADTLDPLGIKATFYITGKYPSGYEVLMTNLVSRGHSIGNHSMTHKFMQFLLPATLFREIMDCRIRLEVSSQQAVNAFAVPFGATRMATDDRAVKRYGEALVNAGLLGSPHGERDAAALFGLDPKRWIGSNIFSINDRDPDPELFRRGLSKATNSISRGVSIHGPHVTMGTHVWQKDEGLRRLSNILSSIAHRKDIWFVNETDWIAFRVQSLNSRFRKVSVDGAKAVFEVTRPEPWDLGADMPLFLSFSETPVAVRFPDDPAVDVLKDGLPSGKGHGAPRWFKMLGPDALVMDGEPTRFVLNLKNGSNSGWRQVNVTLRLPPGYHPAVVKRCVGDIPADGYRSMTFAVRHEREKNIVDDEVFAAAQIDLHDRNGAGRLWAKCGKSVPPVPAPVPRDTCRAAGPFPESRCPGPEFFARMSRPDVPLVDFADGDGAWRRTVRVSGLHPNVSNLKNPDRKEPSGGTSFVAFAYGVRADVPSHGDRWRLKLVVQNMPRARVKVYLNGREIPPKTGLVLRPGLNRLVVVHPRFRNYSDNHEIAVVSEKDQAWAEFVDP